MVYKKEEKGGGKIRIYLRRVKRRKVYRRGKKCEEERLKKII